jgi:hypothetical protein
LSILDLTKLDSGKQAAGKSNKDQRFAHRPMSREALGQWVASLFVVLGRKDLKINRAECQGSVDIELRFRRENTVMLLKEVEDE